MKKTSLCFAAVFAVLFGFFVASCSGGADSPNLTLYMQPSGGSSDSGGGTQSPTPTPTPTPTPSAEYNVTYVITNGSDDMTGESRSSGKYTAQSELTIPQKEGFVFKGWYSDQEQTQAVASFAGLTGDVTLYGHWTGTLYTVVIEGIDGATLAEGSAAVAGFSTEDTTLSLPAYTKRFYDFEGLYLDSEFNGTAVTQIGKDSAEAGSILTLYAKWTEYVCVINYDLLFESGVSNPNTATSVTASTGRALDAPTYTDSEFVFAGWFANYSGGVYSNQVTALTVDELPEEGDSVTLHAKWTHATPWTPSGATVRVTSMQTVADDIAALSASDKEFYLIVTDSTIEYLQLRDVNNALKANATTSFYLDFSSAATKFELEPPNNRWGASSSFYACANLTGITLPKCPSFTSIEVWAFKGCSKLKAIEIPNQVTKIVANAFCNCVALETIYLPEKLLEVESEAFKNCDKLKEIYYNSTNSDWEKITFDKNEYSRPTCYGGIVYVLNQNRWERLYQVNYDLLLENGVTNPNTIVTITASSGAKTLQNPTCSDTNYNFVGWYTGLSNGLYSNQVTTISVGCASENQNSITIHAKWTRATPWTPSGATVHITSMGTIVKDIAALPVGEEFYMLFTDKKVSCNSDINSALKANSAKNFYFDFGFATEQFGFRQWFNGEQPCDFRGCSNLTGITLPECLSLTKISENSYAGCEKLKSVRLPTQCTEIGDFAFKDCSSLETVYLPKNLSKMGKFVFDNCVNLQSVYYNSTFLDLTKVNFSTSPMLYTGKFYVSEQGQWKRVYKIEYNLNYGKWANNYKPLGMIIESESVVLPTAENVSKEGYDFGGWKDYNTGEVLTSVPLGTTNDVKYLARWIARNDTPYKVLHYQENIDDSNYTLYETESMTGTTASYVTPAAKDYPNYEAKPVSRQYINGNGNTEIKIYYKRKTATLTIDLAGGTLDGKTGTITKSGKYGASVPALSNPQKTNYTFMGWNTNGGALPSVYAEDATFTAVWLLNEVRGIEITVDPLSDISVIKSQSGNTVTFTAQECDSYSWALDGAAKGSARTCSIDTSTLLKGTYTLTLEAKKGGKWFSYTAQIKIN